MAVERFMGEMLAPGSAKGRLVFLQSDFTLLYSGGPRGGSVEQELDRFEEHVDGLAAELMETIESLEAESAGAQAQIIRTHLYLIQDRKFHQDVCREIRENARTAERAIESVLRRIMVAFEGSENSLIAERAGDVRDILARLTRRVSRRHRQALGKLGDGEPVILAVKELLPSVVLDARNSRITGFVVEQGTTLSHAAILAKSLGFPILRLSDLHALQAARDEEVLVDATDGSLILHPDPETVIRLVDATPTSQKVDRSDLPVRLWVNVADPSQVSPALLRRTAGIGLYRTEVLFMEQMEDFPSERRQYEAYRSLFDQCPEGCTVTMRTADIGGDKMLPYFPLGQQENPYLGVRANRVYRQHPEIFITQMRAILRAAVDTPHLRIMYPMIGSREDLLFVKRLLAEALRSLRARRDSYRDCFEQGIMIEVPSAAWSCHELLQTVDFASVGTNDLLQYFFAVGRDDANVSQSYRTQDPVALAMLKRLVDVAARMGKSLSICGEIASDPRLLPLLVGLGFEDLSVDVRLLSQVEEVAAALDVRRCRRLGEDCLKAETSQEVRMLLNDSDLAKTPSAVRPRSRGEAIDPVCNRVVNIVESSLSLTDNGRKVYFCSTRCRDEYFYRTRHAPQGLSCVGPQAFRSQ